MQVNKIILPSAWGRDITHKHVTNSNTSVAVFFPGQNYSCELPLLYYTSRSAFATGYDLLMLEYGYQSARTTLDQSQVDNVIQECYNSIQQIINKYDNVVFVSKSLGTYIAGKTAELFSDRSIRHVFLTPLQSSIPLIEKFGGLVVCGTKDQLFAEKEIQQVAGFPNTQLLKVEDADHGLEVEDLHHSLDILKSIVEASNRFLSTK
ncbi:hypothetical protein SD71_20590 [Cohnella kolymensis]|uniref:Alpha/beta hydrolase n=1 Tax=Cohnella kolymensis TaxID=1590652 RepID=A0ABR5A021_9BACL|nr:alpha/beta hydrolase [Cohnella kolymensis]KIL34414.1 hypothetical protein SD71_20590 [Cohnella kolymensis]